MDSIGLISSVDPASLIHYSNRRDVRYKPAIFLFLEQFLLPQVVDTDDVPDPGDELTSTLIEGIGDVFTGCLVKYLELSAFVDELVGLDVAQSTPLRAMRGIYTHTSE